MHGDALMKRYDFTYEPGQPTGVDPVGGFLPGRWWVWNRSQWESPAAAAAAYAKELTDGRWPARVAVLDTEGLGYGDAERLLPAALDALHANLNVKTLVIGDWWFGQPAGWSFQRIVAALSVRGSDDFETMLALARQHRPLVRRTGVVVVLGVVGRINPPADNPDDTFDFYLRKAQLLCGFYREAYPGTEVCVWLSGVCPNEGWQELSIDHCRMLIHGVAPVCDSVAVYGERQQNRNLCQVLSEPL
jgi:hypothetical protein